MPIGVNMTDAAFRQYLTEERQSLRAFAKQSGIPYSVLSRLGRERMPTDEQKQQIAICTAGRVMPSDWYGDLEQTIELRLTENQMARLGRGETVRLQRGRSRFSLVVQKIVPIAATLIMIASGWYFSALHYHSPAKNRSVHFALRDKRPPPREVSVGYSFVVSPSIERGTL